MADITFRSKTDTDTPQPEQVADKTPGVSEKGDTSTKLIATYEDATGTPYTAQYYDIANIWKEKKGGFESEVRTIESYIKDMVANDELDNTTDAADKLYTEIEKKAGVTDEPSTATKLIKLAAYIRMQRDIKLALQWRKERG